MDLFASPLNCPCDLLYIGKTIRPLRLRLAEHRSRLHNKVWEAPIVTHCLQANHAFDQLKCFAIDKIIRPIGSQSKERALLRLEQRWIYTLDTVSPKGLNAAIEWAQCF